MVTLWLLASYPAYSVTVRSFAALGVRAEVVRITAAFYCVKHFGQVEGPEQPVDNKIVVSQRRPPRMRLVKHWVIEDGKMFDEKPVTYQCGCPVVLAEQLVTPF